jgi:hypothetical protein
MRLSKNNSYVEVEDNDWVATLNKISWKNQDKYILG